MSKFFLYKIKRTSDVFFCSSIGWRLKLMADVMRDTRECLRFTLFCDYDASETNWSINAFYVLRVLTQRPDAYEMTKKFEFAFTNVDSK